MSVVMGVYAFLWNPRIGKLLLLHRVLHWSGWECVKGHREENESDESTARREILEETGMTDMTLTPLHQVMTFLNKEDEVQNAVFLATTDSERVTTSFEHDDARWVSYDEAMKLLTWPDSRVLLRSIHEQLTVTR